ncbi:hypothetical protein E0F20_23925 [Citrobacter freundii]|nr:hypothetical protein [Citrobacter freundii]RVR63426.1 hypothetical protein EOL25_03080 [Citrobacter freundii]TBV95108.1 hypothetical protein E0F20_23925 [Citrobacter freundii]
MLIILFSLHLLHCLFVGSPRSPQSHSELCSWGFAQLPPRCSTNDFVITITMKKIQKRGGVAPPKNLLTAQLHRAVFHSRFVMFHGELFVFHAQSVA